MPAEGQQEGRAPYYAQDHYETHAVDLPLSPPIPSLGLLLRVGLARLACAGLVLEADAKRRRGRRLLLTTYSKPSRPGNRELSAQVIRLLTSAW